MFMVFLIILILVPIVGLWLYKHSGKRQIFHLDFVQFVYLFIITPTLFIWSKTFLFYILKQQEHDLGLSINQIFLVDSIYSLIAFFIFAGIAIHTLTKSFQMKKLKDPSFDIFHISEYFHLWWSHLVMFIGGMVLLTVISFANLISPIVGLDSPLQFLAALLVSGILAIVAYLAVWNSDPKLEDRNFMRLMKLCFALFFLIHVGFYFGYEPSFEMRYVGFWSIFMLFLTLVLCSTVIYRSRRLQKLIKKLHYPGWGQNMYTKF